MTRATLISNFEAIIDQVGTAEFSDNVDIFLNQAIKAIFRLLIDPGNVSHPDASGYEEDIHTSEYIAPCKHYVSGSSGSAGIITQAEIEALMPVGRTLARISSFKTADTDAATKIITPVKTSPQVAVQTGMSFYKTSNCRRYLERIADGYKMYPGGNTVYFEGLAIAFPRDLSVSQTEVDLSDFLEPAISYHAAMLAGVAVRDNEYVRNAINIIQGLGL